MSPRPTSTTITLDAKPTLSNMLGSVMSAAGLQGRGEKVKSGSEPEVEGPRGGINTSAKPLGRARSMTDSTSIEATPLTDYRKTPKTRPITTPKSPTAPPTDLQGPPTDRPSSYPPKSPTVPPTDLQSPPTDRPSSYPPKSPTVGPGNYQSPPTDRPTSYPPKSPTLAPTRAAHATSNGGETASTPPGYGTTPSSWPPGQDTPGPDARTRAATSIGGVITFAPDTSQTIDEAPKPPITESPPLPPNTVTAMFATPRRPPASQDTTEVVTGLSSTPSGDTSPPTSTYTGWAGGSYNTINTSTRTDPVDHVSIVTRRGDVVNMADETEIRTCDTRPGVTSTSATFDYAATVVPGLQYPVNMGNETSVRTCDTGPSVTSTIDPFLPTSAYPTLGAATPDSVWSMAAETGTGTLVTPTLGAASPDSMWSVAVEPAGAASPDSMWSVAAETGTVTETEIGMQGGVSTVAASTVFATPAVRANTVEAVETQWLGGMLGSGALGALFGAVLLMGALRGSKKA